MTLSNVRQVKTLAPQLPRPVDSSIGFIFTLQLVPIAEHFGSQIKKEILKLLTRLCSLEIGDLAAFAAITIYECNDASIDRWHSVYKWSVMRSAT